METLVEGWLELESDPGLFTLILEDIGVHGVQVDEIYDLERQLDRPAFGFIFLFRWTGKGRRKRRKPVEDVTGSLVPDVQNINRIFFAHQMIPNSCATHALVSILLNCPNLSMGPVLGRLKEHTLGMSTEDKGWAIGNTPEIAKSHNSHAKPRPKKKTETNGNKEVTVTGRTVDAFHFVSYVPFDGRLYELDGLKSFPIDHGPWNSNEEWPEHFRRVIAERIGIGPSGKPPHDIHFSLMALVPSKRDSLLTKLSILRTNRHIVKEHVRRQNRKARRHLALPCPSDEHAVELSDLTTEAINCKSDLMAPGSGERVGKNPEVVPAPLQLVLTDLEAQISEVSHRLAEEDKKRDAYKIDACRRTHNYEDFISTWLEMLAECGELAGLIEGEIGAQIEAGTLCGKANRQRQAGSKRRSRSRARFL